MAKNFLEYLNSKGTMQDKPKVKDIADEVDMPKGRDIKPPKGQGMVGDQQPYSTDGTGISKSKKSDKGFGDQGDSDLKYDVTKNPKGDKLPTAEHTFLPKMVKDAILVNPKLIEHIVNELSKANLLGPLVAELSSYRETFTHLTEIMASESYGPSVCDRFARSIKESVSPGRYGSGRDEEMDQSDMEGEDEEEDMMDMPEPHPWDDDMEDDPLMGGSDEEGGAPFDEEPPSDEDLEPGMDGMGQPQKRLPMPKALEHLNYSLGKNFI